MCCHARRVLYFLTSVLLKPTPNKNSFTTAWKLRERLQTFLPVFQLLELRNRRYLRTEDALHLVNKIWIRVFFRPWCWDPQCIANDIDKSFFPKTFLCHHLSSYNFFNCPFPNLDTSLNDFKFAVRRKSSSKATIVGFPPKAQSILGSQKRRITKLSISTWNKNTNYH